MTSKRDVANVIVDEIRKDRDVTKNSLISNVSKKTNVGSTTVRDVLVRLDVLEVITNRSIGRAQVHEVNEEMIDKIKKISDEVIR